MPWTGPDFKKRHAKKLSPVKAEKASRIANAIVASGGDEGMAIATGIARAKHNPANHGLKPQ